MNKDLYKITYPKMMAHNRGMVTSIHPFYRTRDELDELNVVGSNFKVRSPSPSMAA